MEIIWVIIKIITAFICLGLALYLIIKTKKEDREFHIIVESEEEIANKKKEQMNSYDDRSYTLQWMSFLNEHEHTINLRNDKEYKKTKKWLGKEITMLKGEMKEFNENEA